MDSQCTSNAPKVLITTTSFAEFDRTPLSELERCGFSVALNKYKRKLTEAEAVDLLCDKELLIAGTEPLTRRVLMAAKKLKVISRCGTGLDNVDLGAAEELGIRVFNTPKAPSNAVAELTVGLMLNLVRSVSVMNTELKLGIWKKRMGFLLHGKKIGIVGFGQIGQRLASLLVPFEAELAFTDPLYEEEKNGVRSMPLNSMLEWADIISIHVSGANNNRPLIGREELARMKRGMFLLNLSRGGLIDEDGLAEAIETGRVYGAALDVFKKEPYTGPLSKMDNVILTPHIGSYAREARIAMEHEAVRNLIEGTRKCQK